MSLISLIYKWLLAIKLLILGIKGSLRTQSPFPTFFEFAEGVGLNINEWRMGEKLEVWNFIRKTADFHHGYGIYNTGGFTADGKS